MSRNCTFSKRALQECIDRKTKPVGSLGRIEALALQIGTLQQTFTPKVDTCQLIIFAADHGIAESGVSAYPSDVTRQMVLNFMRGGAAANVLAKTVGAELCVVDAGVAGEPIEYDNLLSCRVAPGTSNSLLEPAMSAMQREEAYRHGHNVVDRFCADVFCFGEMGIANTSAATLMAHKLLNIPLTQIVGRGTGLDDTGLRRKTEVLQAAARRTAMDLGPDDVVAEYGGFEIAMMIGAMVRAAAAGKIVIVDGYIATVAAAFALKIQTDIAPALVFAHVSAEPGHRHVLEDLGVEPLLDLGMRLGEGTGALLAWPVIKGAAAMLNDMASFDSAGVTGRKA